MTVKTSKKVVKKATKVAKINNTITMTVKQAQNLAAFATKNGKTFKFLNSKIDSVVNVNA